MWGTRLKKKIKDKYRGPSPFDSAQGQDDDWVSILDLLRFEVFGVLNGADFDVGLFAGFVAAEAGDPDFAVADHGSLGVDEEVFVLLLEDGGCDVLGDDAVVVFDESFLVFDYEGLFAGVDLDRVVDEGGDGGGVVLGHGLLGLGEGLLDFDVIAGG